MTPVSRTLTILNFFDNLGVLFLFLEVSGIVQAKAVGVVSTEEGSLGWRGGCGATSVGGSKKDNEGGKLDLHNDSSDTSSEQGRGLQS